MSIAKFINRRILETVGLVTVIAVGIGGIVQLQQPKLKALTRSNSVARDYQKEVIQEKVKLDALKALPSFGFKNLLADWAMLQFIQYYGDGDAREQTGYTLSHDYLEIIVNNNPYFIRAYLIISPASSINGGRPDRTIALMNQGLKNLSPTVPDAYYVWLYKGVDELLFMGDIEAAKKSYSMAAQWAKVNNNPFIERSARNTVHFLETNPHSRAPQVGAWFLVWSNAVHSNDRQTLQMARSNIERLGGRVVMGENGQVFAIPPKE